MKKYTRTLIGSVLAAAGLMAATSAMAGKRLIKSSNAAKSSAASTQVWQVFLQLIPVATGLVWTWTTAVQWPPLS